MPVSEGFLELSTLPDGMELSSVGDTDQSTPTKGALSFSSDKCFVAPVEQASPSNMSFTMSSEQALTMPTGDAQPDYYSHQVDHVGRAEVLQPEPNLAMGFNGPRSGNPLSFHRL